MKKGDRPNPGEELLYHLSGNQEFQQDLLKARKFLGIPEEGFPDEDMCKKWLKDGNALDLLSADLYFQKKYKISIAYRFYIDDYIFFGEIRSKVNKQLPPSVVFERYAHRADMDLGDVEEFYKETGEPYAKLFILGNASKSDVLDYINKNWEKVEEILTEQRGVRKVVRKTIYKKRNLDIVKWCGKTIIELRNEANRIDPEHAPHKSNYKELLIQKILRKKYGYIGESYIKKIGPGK